MSEEQLFSPQVRSESSDAPPDMTCDPFVHELTEAVEKRAEGKIFFPVLKSCSN